MSVHGEVPSWTLLENTLAVMQVPHFFCFSSNSVGEIVLMNLKLVGSAEADGGKQRRRVAPEGTCTRPPPKGVT